MARLNSLPDTINKEQLLFGINQGGVIDEIRIRHAETIRELDLDGYAIGGLAVGETHEEMYHILEETVPICPWTTDLSDGSRYTGKYTGGYRTRCRYV